ncbi:major facilitator superfamily domain-containing protein, partial [Mycena belliarum]
GWNDGSSGPLIPRIQKVYNINFVLVSLTFVLACVASHYLLLEELTVFIWYPRGLSQGYSLHGLGAVCQVIGCTIQAPAPPFPLFLLSFVVNGAGIAIQNAQSNAFVASLPVHSDYGTFVVHTHMLVRNLPPPGAGALSSPIVATQFSELPSWSFHYLVSLGLAFSNVISLISVFRFRNQDEILGLIGEAAGEKSPSEHSNFRQILSLKTVHLLAFFALVYVGVEVTIGGWITTFIIQVRGGGKSAGYISSGFFGGIMVGRLALLWLNKKASASPQRRNYVVKSSTQIGEQRALYLYAALAIGLEFIIWFVPSLIGGAVSVSLIGVFLGPMYPIVMNRVGRVVPRWLLSGSIGWIAGFGQAGSAIFPFITGAIASKTGIRVLQPLVISMMAMFPVLWALVPISVTRRID